MPVIHVNADKLEERLLVSTFVTGKFNSTLDFQKACLTFCTESEMKIKWNANFTIDTVSSHNMGPVKGLFKEKRVFKSCKWNMINCITLLYVGFN